MTEDVKRQETDDTEDLPVGWVLATIGMLIGKDGVFIDGDWVESKDQDPDGAVRLLQLADIGDGIYVNKSSRFLTQAKAEELRCTFLKKDDVLVARMPDPLGRACIFPGESQACVTVVDVCVVRPGENSVVPRWLMYAINSADFRGAVADLQSGSTRLRISRGNLATIIFPVPPLPEQRRIVAEIERRFTELDASIADLKRAQAQLKRYRASVLAAACEGRLVPTEAELATAEGSEYEPADVLLKRILAERRARWEKAYLAKQGKPLPKDDKWKAKYEEPQEPDTSDLPELPEGWMWATLGQVTKIQGGIQKQPSRTPRLNSFPFLRVANVLRGKLLLDDVHTIELFSGELDRLRLDVGDLLIVEGNGSPSEIGRMAIWNGSIPDCVHQNHIIRARPASGILSKYAAFFWNSPFGAHQVLGQASSTSGLHTLSVSKISVLAIPLPPLEEQERIVAEVERRLSGADELEAAVAAGLKQAERLRQAILRDAFTGKLVPQDPTDEPASVLLERIRAARETAASEKKVGGRGRKPKETSALVGATVEKKAPVVTLVYDKAPIVAVATVTGKRRGRPPKNRGVGQMTMEMKADD